MNSCKAKSEYLPVLIEQTRKAHIEAEKRLLWYDRLSKRINVYYACLTVLLSLLSFCFPQCHLIGFLAIGVAVTLTVSAVFASMQDYGTRAMQMRYSYLALQELHFEFDDVLGDEDCERRADRLGRKYTSVLFRTENHDEQDYWRSLQLEEDKKSAKNQEGQSSVCDCHDVLEPANIKGYEINKGERGETPGISKRLAVAVYCLPWVLMIVLGLIYWVLENVCISGV